MNRYSFYLISEYYIYFHFHFTFLISQTNSRKTATVAASMVQNEIFVATLRFVKHIDIWHLRWQLAIHSSIIPTAGMQNCLTKNINTITNAHKRSHRGKQNTNALVFAQINQRCMTDRLHGTLLCTIMHTNVSNHVSTYK